MDLPQHSKIRIIAQFHFIDAWSGESAFMRVNNGKNQEMQYIWTERYDFGKNQDGINVCGAQYLEGLQNNYFIIDDLFCIKDIYVKKIFKNIYILYIIGYLTA